jgi:NAD(P)-dependent dehydrogenase (short-subunit alcohol dehydrogenase family)
LSRSFVGPVLTQPSAVLFQNAGIMHPEDDNALNTEEKIWDLTNTINVKGFVIRRRPECRVSRDADLSICPFLSQCLVGLQARYHCQYVSALKRETSRSPILTCLSVYPPTLSVRKNPTDESKGLHVGGSIINVASFVALLGAATPQLACASFSI